MRRIFIALPVSPELQESIFEWRGPYRNLPVRWVTGANLHVTLVPPWYEGDVEGSKRILESVRGIMSPFEIAFREISFGPSPRAPRLIWATGKTPEGMTHLAETLLRAFGKKPEPRPLKLHVTLARFRPEAFRNFLVREIRDAVSWREEEHSVALMESLLSREGAEYKVLHQVKFSP